MDVPDSIPTSLPTRLPTVDPAAWRRFQEQFLAVFQAHWDRLPTSLNELLAALTAMHFAHGLLLAAVGLVFLFTGWRFYKWLMTFNAAAFGAVFGGAMTVQFGFEPYWWIGALAGGGVLGILAWPLMKLFVALLGGAIGAGLGWTGFQYVAASLQHTDLLPYAWAGAILGAVLLAVLAFLIFRAAVMLATSLQGASLFVAGLLCLLFQAPTLRESLTEALQARPPALLLIVLGVSAAGLAVQIHASQRAQNAASKKSSAG